MESWVLISGDNWTWLIGNFRSHREHKLGLTIMRRKKRIFNGIEV